MKLVIQRVNSASVTIENKLYSSINKGLLVLFGVEKDDKEDMIEYFAQKLLKLRIFEDEQGKMNKSVLDINGEILAVSQFTLCADCKKGTRPSFDSAKEPGVAKEYYEKFDSLLKEIDEEYRTTLINFGKYKLVMFAMAKLMEMKTTEQNKVALYLFNDIK